MTNKAQLTVIVTALACLFYQTLLFAGVYKWQDDSGQIHYSDQPNQPNAEKFTIREDTTTKPRTINKSKEENGDNQPAKKVSKPALPKVSKKEKRRLCNKAKTDVANINSHGRMREINSKGEHIPISEKLRQQRLSSAKKQQREFCR